MEKELERQTWGLPRSNPRVRILRDGCNQGLADGRYKAELDDMNKCKTSSQCKESNRQVIEAVQSQSTAGEETSSMETKGNPRKRGKGRRQPERSRLEKGTLYGNLDRRSQTGVDGCLLFCSFCSQRRHGIGREERQAFSRVLELHSARGAGLLDWVPFKTEEEIGEM